ncbi:RRQRL motif-containing zinc-binding protein [Nocardia wallacei]|uniref:RRQRL motif-containing zinc-binding protein n=1 Tax=Nocardia wallacei TaxID=480035 RepID=UPI002457BE87|nr:RRQRL motif-containing zinc-binding protein [Nocardia wallacei]
MIGPKDIHRRDLPDVTGERFGLPTYEWRTAPAGLATYRQLQANGLRPNGQDIAAYLVMPSSGGGQPRNAAYLYREDLAAPKRQATPAQRAALAKATREHQLRAWERRGFNRAAIGEIGDPGPQWDVASSIESGAAEISETARGTWPQRDWGLDR